MWVYAMWHREAFTHTRLLVFAESSIPSMRFPWAAEEKNGVTGDTTANMMWRLQNGEVVPGLQAGAVVLHIGFSDLTYASFQVLPPQHLTHERRSCAF